MMASVHYHRAPLVRDVVSRVAFETGLAVPDLLGASRWSALSRARFAVILVARLALRREMSMIGRVLNRERTTIAHGLQRAEALRQRDPAFRMLTDKLLAEFTGGA